MSTAVELLAPDEADAVVDVLVDAFFDYPVMRYVLGERDDYPADLHRMITLFTMSRVHRGEPMLGIRAGGGLVAAALVSRPADRSSPDALNALRVDTWAALGPGPRARYERFGAATLTFAIDTPHLHLNMIGARRVAQGRGHGRALLERVHAMSAADPASEGVTLTTELDGNEALYRKFGYDVLGRADVEGAFVSRAMWRVDGA